MLQKSLPHANGASPARNSLSGVGRRDLLKLALAGTAVAATKAPASGQPVRGRTYVLIHGAWFGGWVWKGTAAALRADGHTVYAPSLTGLGDRRHLLRPGINLDTHSDDIVNLITDEELRDVVLVGWSYGGMVVGNVLARAPDKVASVVYLDAFLPDAGRSLASYVYQGEEYRRLAEQAAANQDVSVPDIESMLAGPEMAKSAKARVSPHPIQTFLQPSKAPKKRPEVPHTYILASQFKRPVFKPFYERFRDEKLGDAHVLDTRHATMLTDPEGTTALLKRVR
jgi:pimeloyl-ACP methyl ester carboxylesterase